MAVLLTCVLACPVADSAPALPLLKKPHKLLQLRCTEVISLAQFLFKLAFSISFHKTIEAVASVPAHRLRLQSAVLTRVVAV